MFYQGGGRGGAVEAFCMNNTLLQTSPTPPNNAGTLVDELPTSPLCWTAVKPSFELICDFEENLLSKPPIRATRDPLPRFRESWKTRRSKTNEPPIHRTSPSTCTITRSITLPAGMSCIFFSIFVENRMFSRDLTTSFDQNYVLSTALESPHSGASIGVLILINGDLELFSDNKNKKIKKSPNWAFFSGAERVKPLLLV